MEQTTSSQQPECNTLQSNNAARQYIRPVASIIETTGGFVVAVEMPGVSRAGLDITFDNGQLTVCGHRSAVAGDFAASGTSEALHRESRQADFRRIFEVDSTIDAARIAAKLDQGLLTLDLPKAESAIARRIEIGGLN